MVLSNAFEWKIGQTSVFRDANTVFAASPESVPDFQIGELAAGAVRGECDQSPPVAVGDPQLGAGVRLLAADDHPHPGRPRRQIQHAGQFGDVRVLTGLSVRGVGRSPRFLG